MIPYCQSRVVAKRRKTRTVMIGSVGVGGGNPIRIQSMTTTPTRDVAGTVEQTKALVEAGCEIVRITAPNLTAAKALKTIRETLRGEGIQVPLVADIHFLPNAALEAAEHVDKVRINPGNYADRKSFAVREYSDEQYNSELERLHDAFSPIVLKCKKLGRSMRIGTNHGSLSDRIMNRYGDTPLGMVESALEFIRIAESHGFRDIILSLKASNPKIMIQAYRLASAKMAEEGMAYPLHLGVTEAGDGEDARIKSAIGIGGLLYDGLGDTIRVSLTEDPVYEIPVARDLAEKAMKLWSDHAGRETPVEIEAEADPYHFTRREVNRIELNARCAAAVNEPPRVVIPSNRSPGEFGAIREEVRRVHARLEEAKIEGLLLEWEDPGTLADIHALRDALEDEVRFFILNLGPKIKPEMVAAVDWRNETGWVLLCRFHSGEGDLLAAFADAAAKSGLIMALDISPRDLPSLAPVLRGIPAERLLFTLSRPHSGAHPLGGYRQLARELRALGLNAPLWIRITEANALEYRNYFGDRLLEGGILAGALLCDGIGDIISVETEPDLARAAALAYNILQGSRARISKTEYVACPSCGRTLFDLQTTTQRIRSQTNHLKGVTIAVMGCIVNGPGEMADADFGYVGGAPGKVNLYVGKKCVRYHIPEKDAVGQLLQLIKKEGKWTEPLPATESQKGEEPDKVLSPEA